MTNAELDNIVADIYHHVEHGQMEQAREQLRQVFLAGFNGAKWVLDAHLETILKQGGDIQKLMGVVADLKKALGKE